MLIPIVFAFIYKLPKPTIKSLTTSNTILHGLDCKRLLKKFGQKEIQLCPPMIRLRKRFKKLNTVTLITVEHVKHPIQDKNNILTHL